MSRMKSIFAVLVVAAVVGIVPLAHATYVPVALNIGGSSAMWQTVALGAYNGGTNIQTASPDASTCHWTNGKFFLNDMRGVGTTQIAQDSAAVWVVWSVPHTVGQTAMQDCSDAVTNNTYEDYWLYVKPDSVVGVRCYFAGPIPPATVSGCTIVPSAAIGAGANLISLAPQDLWGDGSQDSNMPAALSTLLTNGVHENAAATDIRPEDANFASCRVNSPLGGAQTGTDHLDGLGYSQGGATQLAGDCFLFTTQAQGVINGVGSKILSGYPASTGAANVVSFAIPSTLPLPKDPITGGKVPAFTVTAFGAAPILFVINRSVGPLAHLTTASERQLQTAFSGTNCDASAFGLAAGAINIFLREPLSGTYNTTEATVMRYPTAYPSPVAGISQEKNVGANNPLAAQAGTCVAGLGARYRAIGTSEEVKSVLNSNTAFTGNFDGIGYAFFSYGNVTSIAGNNNYGYIQLNGVDPIFASYAGNLDPGQPTQAGEGGFNAGTLPLRTPCGTGTAAFPCNEKLIWRDGFSFPNLRNGTYRSWSLLRILATGTASANVVTLRTASNKYVVSTVPDYVPSTAQTVGGTADLGLKLLRSHYQQKDGSNPPVNLGGNPINVSGACTGNEPTEIGGDMGGMIIPTTVGVTIETQCQILQSSDANGGLGPVLRP